MGLKRVIDPSVDARGSNRKAKQKSNPYLVAMHCGKNQCQFDRAGVLLTLDSQERTASVCVCVCIFVSVGHYEGKFLCVLGV